MRVSVVERKLLWAAIEDYAGLWELIWELASSCPKIREAERRAAAETALRELLKHRCVELYERREIGGNETLVPKERWNEVLSNDANWQEPSAHSTEVVVAATQLGEEVYAAEVDL